MSDDKKPADGNENGKEREDFDVDRFVELCWQLYDRTGAHLTRTQLTLIKRMNGRFTADPRFKVLIEKSEEKLKEDSDKRRRVIARLKTESEEKAEEAERVNELNRQLKEAHRQLMEQKEDAENIAEVEALRADRANERLDRQQAYASNERRSRRRFGMGHIAMAAAGMLTFLAGWWAFNASLWGLPDQVVQSFANTFDTLATLVVGGLIAVVSQAMGDNSTIQRGEDDEIADRRQRRRSDTRPAPTVQPEQSRESAPSE